MKTSTARMAWVITVLLLLCAAFGGGIWAGIAHSGRARRQLAESDVNIALRLSDPEVSFRKARQQYSLPPALVRRDDAIQYYLLRASEVDDGRNTGANYFLGIFFLSRNCEVAQYYLTRQIAVQGRDPRVDELLHMVREQGCPAVASKFYANRIPAID